MIRTIVCEKEGCAGNSFYIKDIDNTLNLICEKCNGTCDLENEKQDIKILSTCSTCHCNTFKVFRDTDSNKLYLKCTTCGNPPETIYVDIDGNQISYNTKILYEVKEIVYSVDQRLCSLENKIGNLESEQEILEQSVAYITKFLSQ